MKQDTFYIAKQAGDAKFLRWLHDRLEFVHGENPNVDYMHRLRDFVAWFEGDPLKGAEGAIAWANNSLFGSHGFFLSLNGGTADEHHLDRAIEGLKEYGRKEYLRAEKAEREREAAVAALRPFAAFADARAKAWEHKPDADLFYGEKYPKASLCLGDFRRAALASNSGGGA